MRKPSLVAVIAAITLVGCASTTSLRSTPASSSSASSEGMGGTSSAVAACFRAGGAYARGPQAAGPGLAVYAVTRDGGNVGFVQAGDASTIKAIGNVFARAGDHITMLEKDPTAFEFYKRTLTKKDSDLLSKCSARPFGSTAALSTLASSEGMGGTSSPAAACFRAAGAYVKGPQAAGPGSAIYAVTPDGRTEGFVKAADASAIKSIAKAFTHAGDHITMLGKNPTVFVFYKGTITKKDSDLLLTCSTRS